MAVMRNPTATIGAVFVLVLTLVAVLGPLIRPDASPNANTQMLAISRQKPGFEVELLRLEYPDGRTVSMPIEAIDTVASQLRVLPFGDTDWIIPEPPDRYELGRRRFWLGTDTYGRDFLSRLMAGSAISLSVGFVAVLISLITGVVLGALSGYFGGWIDAVISWIINVVWSIPTLLMVIAITLAFGKGFWQVFVAIGLTMWVEVARIVRGQFISLREKEYVEAAKALGYSSFRIIRRHILPNAIGPVIVICAANFASAILIEAGLSFLGLGAQIPVPSWGNMIKEHYPLVTTDLAYLALLPGVLIMALVLSFMLVGNGLRDRLDVRA